MSVRILSVLFIAAALAVPAASAQVWMGPDSSRVMASATVDRFLPPDRATLFLEATGTGPSADVATLGVADAHGRVVAALEAAGVPREDITDWGFASGESMAARAGMMPPGARGEATEAKLGIRVMAEPDRVQAIAAAAARAGAAVLTVVYEVTETQELREEMLREAVRRARADAEVMAEAAGGRLGRLVHVSTSPEYSDLAYRERMLQVGYRGQGVTIMPANVSVRVTVQGTWLVTER